MKKNEKAVSPVIATMLMVVITVVLVGVVFVSISDVVDDRDIKLPESVIVRIEQGDGNIDSGCLLELQLIKGKGLKISDYRIFIGKEGCSPKTLNWELDGNKTHYSIDGNRTADDGEYWDVGERMGFDAPPGLEEITDCDTIEVKIVNMNTNTVIFARSFEYRD